MYGYTAAHKTLPLPSYVRVTNLENGRQVVVRINDRGPFVKNRLIDLSYTAARKLDMIGPGTARVEVEVLGARDQDSDESERGSSEKSEAMAECPVSIALQVAAFGSEANAVRLQKRLLDQGFEDVVVVEVEDGSMARYKVRVVSIQDEQAMHVIIQRLLEAGYRSPGQVTQRSLCGQ
jgi:rare lipoprotein A